MNDTYTDLRVRIGGKEAQGYPVEAVIDGSMTYRGTAALDPDSLRRYEQMDKLGGELAEGLFGDDGHLLLAFGRARGLATETEGRLRVRLEIDETAPELHPLAWERLYNPESDDPGAFAVSPLTPFSRYTALAEAEPKPAYPPLRILFAISNPANLDAGQALDVPTEIKNLSAALGNLREWGDVKVKIMAGRAAADPATAQLLEALRDQGYEAAEGPKPTTLSNVLEDAATFRPHVLHFLGHGSFDSADAQRSFLWMEDERGELELVGDLAVARRLGALYPQPHLVFLAACESAATAKADASAGLAQRLVRAGIPAVIAMRTRVGMEVARGITHVFYRQLLLHGLVDRAINEARAWVWKEGQVDWSIPVLFMRLQSGKLVVPDPVVQTIRAVHSDPSLARFHTGSGSYLDFPLEVIHLAGGQSSYSPDLLEPEATAARPLIEALEDTCARQIESGRPMLIVLLGYPGSGKSTQVMRFLWETANSMEEKLQASASATGVEPGSAPIARVIPVYVDLRAYEYRGQGDPLEDLIFRSLRTYWPEPAPTAFDRLPARTVLRVILDNGDDLADDLRAAIYKNLLELLQRIRGEQQIILTSNPYLFDRKMFEHIRPQQLIIQPLSQRRVRHFLENGARAHGYVHYDNLVNALNQMQIFDIVSNPRFLALMIQRAQKNDIPTSRVAVIERLVEDGVANVSGQHGMRSHATETLYRLAWRMQDSGHAVLPIGLAFEIMATARGNRGYEIEALFSQLVDEAEILARVGDTHLRFTSASVQSYCCARAIAAMDDAQRDQVLGTIASALEQRPRMRWWSDTIVFLCGILQGPEIKTERNRTALAKLMNSLVFGGNLLRGERVFVAARALMETPAPENMLEPERSSVVRKQVWDALHWRSLAENEVSLAARLQAIRLLGQVADDNYTLHLCRLAFDRIRRNLRGTGEYEFGAIRTTAVTALIRLATAADGEKQLANAVRQIGAVTDGPSIGGQLGELMKAWKEGNIGELKKLQATSEVAVASAATMALGDTIARLVITSPEASEGHIESLKGSFLERNTDETVRWAITHALALVNKLVIDDAFVSKVRTLINDPAGEDDSYRSQLRKCCAYLIGRIRAQGNPAHDFLTEECLKATRDARVWSTAIEALGWLANDKDRVLLERIAEGLHPDQDDPLRDHFDETEEVGADYVRSKAVEALSSLGDWQTLAKLQDCRDRDRMAGCEWSPRLTEAFYRTSEEIYWRLNDERVGGPEGAFTTAV